MMPSSRSAGISLASASALRTSETVTCAPFRRRNRTAARPDFPSPTTKTFLPLSSIILGLFYGFRDFLSVIKRNVQSFLETESSQTHRRPRRPQRPGTATSQLHPLCSPFQLFSGLLGPSTWPSGRNRQSNSTADTLSAP